MSLPATLTDMDGGISSVTGFGRTVGDALPGHLGPTGHTDTRHMLLRRRINLDEAANPEGMDVDDVACVPLYMRHVLRYAVSGDFDAVYVFFHEEAGCARICLWKQAAPPSGTWYEYIPVRGITGYNAIRTFLGRHAFEGRNGRAIEYSLVYQKGRISLESPHEWEARMFLGNARPAAPPYVLMLRHPVGGMLAPSPP